HDISTLSLHDALPIYSRFFHKLMRDEGLVSGDEPFERLLCQGMVNAESFFIKEADGKENWIEPENVTIERDDKGRLIKASHKQRSEEHTSELQSRENL